MYTTTLALVLAIAATAGAGCSKKKAAATTTPTPAAPAPAAATKVTPETLEQAEVVSPALAVATDLRTRCGIKAVAAASDPTFDYDQYELGPDDRGILDQIATCLTTGALKGQGLELIGRADPRGTEEYNLGLGSRRAAAVGQYLGRLGVTQGQLAVTTRGAIDASGTDEAGWRQDRRVDIQLR